MIDTVITLTGTKPLLMHNSRLANPLDPQAKALKKYTSKRLKTDEDHEAIARLEFLGSLYFDSDIPGVFIPGQNIFKSLVEGARLTKAGKKIERGLFVKSDVNPLSYKGPKDADGLYAAGMFFDASVKVGQQRVMRRRPWFPEWKVQADITIDPSVLELNDLIAIAESAGQYVGLGDWRPRFGRFESMVEGA